MSSDDVLRLLDEPPPQPELEPWPVLVVDDDPEVHEATRLALRGTQLLGRPLQLEHAHSAREARARLAEPGELAVILLDVVMETEQAGLELVDFIRSACGLLQTRIILRTGQPGYAPELGIVDRYDINDYRTKSELTRTRLITALSAALRSYEQIRTIAENRRGLELIVRAAPGLLRPQALGAFAEGVLVQLAALLKVRIEGIVCAQRGSPFDRSDRRMYGVGAAGQLGSHVGQPLDALPDSAAVSALQAAFDRRAHVFNGHQSVLFLNCGNCDAAVYIACPERPLESVDRQLLEVFGANITGCYANLRRFEEVTFTAYHDGLTGLLNRSGFLRALDERPMPAGARWIALLDLRQFADLNDGLGQDVGDLLLQAVTQRLQQQLGEHCSLARIDGDVFAVAGPRRWVNVDTLQSLFIDPFPCGGHRLPTQAALGLAECVAGPDGALASLRRAGIALKRAKSGGHAGHAFFQPEMEERMRERLALAHRLRDALEAGALEVWYQPKIELASGRLDGLEALARWPDPEAEGGMRSPAVFIPLAEYTGLIGRLGEFVLERACQALQALDADGQPPHRLAVNVAMPQLRQARFVGRVRNLVQRYGLEPTQLEIEITESVALEDPRVVRASLEALRALGATIAIDDFGTGYSSLAQLRDMPIDVLKLDRSFVQALDAAPGVAFAETIMRMAHRLGLATVAEGVDTPEQAQTLERLGCTSAQGFLFARPMPLSALRDWLARRAPASD